MARASIKKLVGKKKNTIKRMTKGASLLIDARYYGAEPEFSGVVSQHDYGRALNWYNYMCDVNDARQYINKFLIDNGLAPRAKQMNSVSDPYIPRTAAWIARMFSRGAQLPETALPFFTRSIKEALSTVAEKPVRKQATTVRDRVKEKAIDIIADIEQLIDTNEPFSLFEWLRAHNVAATYSSFIIDHYKPWLAEMVEAYRGKDADLKHAYSHFTKSQLKQRIELIGKIIEDAAIHGEIIKKVRVPRKPRPVSLDKKLQFFKCQREDSTLKIASVAPAKIIGAKELWTYNTRYKIITVFRADDKLDISRTSVTGYNPENSWSRRAGRNAQLVVEKIISGGKMILKKIDSELSSEVKMTDRIGENTILLRVL